jgi:peptide/nickel transport system substrate-binding protein
MRWKKPVIAAAALAMMSAAACGGGGGSTSIPTGSPSEGGAAGKAIDMTSVDGPAPAIPGATKGGTLYTMYDLGLPTMDPTDSYYVHSTAILSSYVVRSLTQYVYRDGDAVLIPDLATSWKSNKDYTKWTFTLRPGIKFENGDPVTNDDWLYGIERSFDRDTFTLGPSYSNDYFKDGDTYKGPYASNKKYTGVTFDGNKMTIQMSRPFPDMAYWGSFPAMSPIPPGDASNPATYKNHPLSTGPYKFGKFDPGVSLQLVRNDQWDPNTDPGRHAYPDEIDMTFTDNLATIDQTVITDTGKGQQTLSMQNLAAADYPTAVQKGQDRLVTGTTSCVYYWGPDYRKITDKKVRQAIGWAYPYIAAWKANGEIVNVTRIPSTTILPPGLPGRVVYDPLGNKGKVTDTAKAKQILKSAGKLGYELKFLYIRGDDQSEAVKEQIVKSLTKAGFKASPVAVGVNQYYTVLADPDADINVRSTGWCSDWPTGLSWFEPVFRTVPGGLAGSNYTFFSEKDVDQRITQVEKLPLAKQPHAWGELDKYIMTKYYPMIIVGVAGDVFMHGSKVGGMQNDPILAMPTFKDIYIKQ